MMSVISLVGKGLEAIQMIVDENSYRDHVVGDVMFDSNLGVGAFVGTGTINGAPVTVIANNSKGHDPRYPVVYVGIIGLEEAYKMAEAVYYTIEADRELPPEQKRPILLLVDTPGNGPGKLEEIMGMNKATGAYQLALSEARKLGHPVLAVVVGRAISGGFLCHGLQADQILTLSSDYKTMIHVMPLSSIARITKLDIERLNELSTENPVFAAGPEFFYRLGGVEEIIKSPEDMRETIILHITEIRELKAAGKAEELGPMSRGTLGAKRGGRTMRPIVMEKMKEEFRQVEAKYLL